MIRRFFRWTVRWALRLIFVVFLLIVAMRWINPPLNYYQSTEWIRLGALDRDWEPLSEISPHLGRSVVAAEDANFCNHWGFDFEAIQDVLESGSKRGASTITQQVAKNVFLWQGRSYLRKGLEAGFSLVIELLWGKRRILEVYLNVAEFDEGVFGAEAAAQHYFGISAKNLTLTQSSRLAMVLPSPKTRSASRPTNSQIRRAQSIASGARTIHQDGRSACFGATEEQ